MPWESHASSFGSNGPALSVWYYGLTEDQCEISLALCFTELVTIPEAYAPSE